MINRRPTRILCLLVVVLLGACATTHVGRLESPPPPKFQSEFEVTRDVVVSPRDWPVELLADVYRPQTEGPQPAVLLVHGGAWKRGDRDQVKGLAERIAARGYVVVNSTYRLVPDALFPAQLRDVQVAIQWMREQGGEYGIDPERIGGFAYSAGAHLISLAASVAEDPEWGMENTQLKAIVAGGNPSNLMRFEGGYLVPNFLGGTIDEIPETFRAASPITYVRADHPPVYQYHATLDNYVPIEQAEAYRGALSQAGVPNELFILHGHGHISAFFADDEAVSRGIDFLDRYLR